VASSCLSRYSTTPSRSSRSQSEPVCRGSRSAAQKSSTRLATTSGRSRQPGSELTCRAPPHAAMEVSNGSPCARRRARRASASASVRPRSTAPTMTPLTSKVCPCGTCTLEDVPPAGRILPLDASRRPRRHTGSDGPSSPICCALKPFADRGMENDRDELACMNILRCTAAGLRELRPMRPIRFCSDLWRKRRLAPSAN
jgi:hypothetical protein